MKAILLASIARLSITLNRLDHLDKAVEVGCLAGETIKGTPRDHKPQWAQRRSKKQRRQHVK